MATGKTYGVWTIPTNFLSIWKVYSGNTKKSIIDLIKKTYKIIFWCALGDQDKSFPLDVILVTCTNRIDKEKVLSHDVCSSSGLVWPKMSYRLLVLPS